jgi:hypothetical protein
VFLVEIGSGDRTRCNNEKANGDSRFNDKKDDERINATNN